MVRSNWRSNSQRHPFDDEQIGALTWDLWMNKTGSSN